jgi:RHS repeat-associated protein
VDYSEEATPDVELEYDPDGNVIAMSDGTGESAYEYDQLGRLVRTEDGHGEVVGYEYDLGEDLTGITYPNGKSISREFDPAGRLEKVTDWLGGTTTFGYNPDSGLETITFPAETGDVDHFAFNRADQMSEAKFSMGTETLASLSYMREKVGQIEEEVAKGLPGAEKTAYGYDENDRLTSVGTASYEYDPADNIVKAPGKTYEYDAASQLKAGTGISFEYDTLGERVKSTPGEGPSTSYAYDQAGNLISLKRPEEGEVSAINESFAYDGSGLMSSKSGEATDYLTWDQSSSLPLLLSEGASSYIYGPGGLPIEQISAKEEPSFLHHDQLGSTRLLTDAAGEPSATFSYGPYGGLEGHTGTTTTPLGFAGQYTDPASGLQYLRARFYDAATGQFLTRDPWTALTQAPYGYANESPLTYYDPSGMVCVGVSRVEGIPVGPSISLGDCASEAANAAVSAGEFAFNHPGLVTAPAVAAACIAQPEACPLAVRIGLGVVLASDATRLATQECFTLRSALEDLLVTAAAALPGGVFDVTAGRYGPELSVTILRILHALLDGPGVAAEGAHAASGR